MLIEYGTVCVLILSYADVNGSKYKGRVRLPLAGPIEGIIFVQNNWEINQVGRQ